MDRTELDEWFTTSSGDVAKTDDWIRANSSTFEDTIAMIAMFLNSNPDDIDFSKEFICFYTVLSQWGYSFV